MAIHSMLAPLGKAHFTNAWEIHNLLHSLELQTPCTERLLLPWDLGIILAHLQAKPYDSMQD